MSKRKDRRDAGKEAFWREAVRGQAASGLSVRGYCRREGISEASFYAWRRELRLRRQEARAGKRPSPRDKKAGGKQPAAEPARQAKFVPVTVHQNGGMEAGLELALSVGMVLRLPAGTSPAAVAALVAELERHGC